MKKSVKFSYAYKCYCKDEVAGFPKKEADRLISQKIAVPFISSKKKPTTKISEPNTKK